MTSDSFAGSCLGATQVRAPRPSVNVKRRAISDVPDELQKRSHQLKNRSSASNTERTMPEPQSMKVHRTRKNKKAHLELLGINLLEMVDGGWWLLDGREDVVVGLFLSPLILKGKGKGFPKMGWC